MRTLRSVVFLLFVSLGTALCAKASPAPTDPLIFGLSESSGYLTLGPNSGIGQAVTVGENLSINDFGFYLEQIPTSQVNFFIYDATTLSTETFAPIAGTAKGWDYLTGLNVDLNAGDKYYFGLYATSGKLYVGTDPTASFFSDGLGITGGVTVSGSPIDVSSLDFNTDVPTTTTGTGDITLRIFSTDPPGVTPEPSSLMLLGTGILAGAATLRRRFMR